MLQAGGVEDYIEIITVICIYFTAVQTVFSTGMAIRLRKSGESGHLSFQEELSMKARFIFLEQTRVKQPSSRKSLMM